MRSSERENQPVSVMYRLLQKQVLRSPNTTALVCDDIHISYSCLKKQVDELADRIGQYGARRGHLIAVEVDRSPELLVVLFAIFKVGAAYVPIDSSFQVADRWGLVDGLRASMLITTTECTRKGFVCERIIVGRRQLVIGRRSHLSKPVDGGLFAIMYTSGTTGNQKAVAIRVSSVLNRLKGMWRSFPFKTTDVSLLHRSHAFVGSTWDLFGPLLGGIPTVILQNPDAGDPKKVWRTLVDKRISHLGASPSFWQRLLDCAEQAAEGSSTLRVARTGGSVVPPEIVHRWRKILPGARLLNVYGSTECLSPLIYDTALLADCDTVVPIGAPFHNTRVSVIDAGCRPVADGTLGEIAISGPCVAAGYFRNPALTARQFVQVHEGAQDDRLFRTGDYGRVLPNGFIEVVGRLDDRVKIRGFTVDLKDVENSLQRFPGVVRSGAITRVNYRGELRLVAYVEASTAISRGEVIRAIRGIVPSYMVPSNIFIVDKIPTTASGKINKAALKALQIRD